MINPLLLIILPLAVAPVVYVLRRWSALSSLLAAATTLLVARLYLSTPFGWSSQIWGREMALEAPDRLLLAFVFALAGGMFLFVWRIPQGWSLPPFGLVILSLLSTALMLRNFLLAVLLLEIAAAFTVFLIQGGRRGSIRAALRYLIMMALAIPPFLFTSRLFDLHALNPGDLGLVRLTVVLLSVGFGLLLGVVPFQAWLSALGTEALPIVTAFVCSVVNGVVFFLMLGLLQRYSWLMVDSPAQRILTLAGLLTACAGGLLAFSQQDLGRLLAYAALSDLGFILLSLGRAEWGGAVFQFLNRSLAVTLAAMGLSLVRYYVTSDAFHELSGVARRMPFAVLGLVGGGLSLAGFPLTGGFVGRWLLYRPDFQEVFFTVALILAGAGVAIGYLRGLKAMLGPSGDFASHLELRREPILAIALIVLLTVLCLVMGLYPRLILPVISSVIKTYTFAAP